MQENSPANLCKEHPLPLPRYTKVAIFLHWLIGLSIIALLALGLVMEDLPQEYRFFAFQFHKSLGLTVLLLSVFRLIWRLTHRPPPYPNTMKLWEKKAAQFVHFFLYFLMLAIPLSGWALVSSSPRGIPTIWFGLFQWPSIPFWANSENKEVISNNFADIHGLLAWGAIALITIHFGAALKHQFYNRDDILSRMLPFRRYPK